jgi:glucose/mannose-6-phosphate isomerase
VSILDDPSVYREVDPTGLAGRIAAMPIQCRDAWARALAFPLPDAYRRAERVLVLGMGGSAIAADILADLQEADGGAPVEVHRGYGRGEPPDNRTLLIVSSYSGNTEETLSAFDRAWKQGQMAVAMTHGGALAGRCAVMDVPVFMVDVEGEPRCTLGYGLFGMLGMLQRLQLGHERSGAVVEAIREMQALLKEVAPDQPLARNRAKALAEELHGRVPVVIGAEILRAVAARWKAQVMENAKGLAFSEALPEWDHNGIEGLRFPSPVEVPLSYVLLESPLYHQRVGLRFKLSAEAILEHGFPCSSHTPQGRSRLAQMMTAVLFGDFVSYYLAILNHVDPASTPNLDRLKRGMAGR